MKGGVRCGFGFAVCLGFENKKKQKENENNDTILKMNINHAKGH